MGVKFQLYNGKVVMEYDPKKHMYLANRIPVPSVTRITGIIDKPALVPWAVNQTADRIRKLWQPDKTYTAHQIDEAIKDAKGARYRTSGKALNIGSMAHDWIEQLIKSRIFGFDVPEMPDYDPVARAVKEYIKWESEHRVQYVSSERRVYSRQHMYSGTADVCLMVDGKLTMCDLKTSKGIYSEYYLQCAAYAGAIQEEDGVKFDRLMILRLPKTSDDTLEIGETDEVDPHLQVFLHCLHTWRWKNKWEAVPI